jgi:hypothetical protein
MNGPSLYEALDQRTRGVLHRGSAADREDSIIECMDDIDELYQAGLISVDQRGELWGLLIRAFPRGMAGGRSAAAG